MRVCSLSCSLPGIANVLPLSGQSTPSRSPRRGPGVVGAAQPGNSATVPRGPAASVPGANEHGRDPPFPGKEVIPKWRAVGVRCSGEDTQSLRVPIGISGGFPRIHLHAFRFNCFPSTELQTMVIFENFSNSYRGEMNQWLYDRNRYMTPCDRSPLVRSKGRAAWATLGAYRAMQQRTGQKPGYPLFHILYTTCPSPKLWPDIKQTTCQWKKKQPEKQKKVLCHCRAYGRKAADERKKNNLCPT